MATEKELDILDGGMDAARAQTGADVDGVGVCYEVAGTPRDAETRYARPSRARFLRTLADNLIPSLVADYLPNIR